MSILSEGRAELYCLMTARHCLARGTAYFKIEESHEKRHGFRSDSGPTMEARPLPCYVIWAIENCGFTPDDIQRVVSELHFIFDMKSLELVWDMIKNGKLHMDFVKYLLKDIEKYGTWRNMGKG